MIRLLVIDDHSLIREGLKHLVEDEDDIIICAETGDGREALGLLQNQEFDLILLDVSMPGIHGVELIIKIREIPSSPPILMLSMHDEPQIVKRNLKASAAGYITKDSSAKDLLKAIRKVASGGHFISADIAEKLALEHCTNTSQVPHELLSKRELDILHMLAKGKKISEIAKELFISSKTVSTHKVRLMQKMQIDSDAKLIQYAITHGMTE